MNYGNVFITALLLLLSCKDKTAVHDIHEHEVFEPGKLELESVLRPTDEYVISAVPVVVVQKREKDLEIEALGTVTYDNRQVGVISSRVSGRIEKLYVRYRYQKVSKGQKILDIYSPELLTTQQELLFLIRNDPANTSFINAAKQRLLLLGMSNVQLQEVIRTGKPATTVSVYSSYSGHLHESTGSGSMLKAAEGMGASAGLTEELSLKEGMYLQKGQSVFIVSDPGQAWVILNVYGDNQGIVKVGNLVRVVPESAPEKDFRAKINFIEPFYREGSRTMTARVYFNNSALQVPIGSQVRATIFGNSISADWLPREAVLSLGLEKVVFLKSLDGFKAHKITTGVVNDRDIQILGGLGPADSVAANAQFLVDSESFIRVN